MKHAEARRDEERHHLREIFVRREELQKGGRGVWRQFRPNVRRTRRARKTPGRLERLEQRRPRATSPWCARSEPGLPSSSRGLVDCDTSCQKASAPGSGGVRRTRERARDGSEGARINTDTDSGAMGHLSRFRCSVHPSWGGRGLPCTSEHASGTLQYIGATAQ